jgi:hypothetical protein
MKNKKTNSVSCLLLPIGFLIIFGACTAMYMQNNRAIVDATVSKLAQQADNQTKPTTFSADSVLENHCPDIAVKLAKQGYELSTGKKKLTSFVDKAMACHDNEVIKVESK